MARERKMNEFTIEEMEKLWYRYYPIFDAELKLDLLFVPRAKVPYLFVDKSNATYTDKHTIHIGLGNIYARTESSFVLQVLYLIGHESGHIKHTPQKPWEYGLSEGVMQLCRIMSDKVEGPGKRVFRKHEDIDKFVEFLKTNGMNISVKSLQKFCHFIQNSLEDGREERLQAKENSDFKARMRACRGMTWLDTPVDKDFVKKAEKDPAASLSMKLNQVLSLATTSLYQRGFFDFYAESELFDKCEELIPHIDSAVKSGTCRKCINEALAIEKILADEILEASKTTPFEDLMNELAKNLSDNAVYSTSDKGELTGTGDDSDSSDVFDGTNDMSGNGNGTDSDDSENGSNNTTSPETNGEVGNMSTDKNDAGGKKQGSGCSYNHKSQRAGKCNEGDSGSDVSDFDAVSKAVDEAMQDAANQASGMIDAIVEATKKKPEHKEKSTIFKPVIPLQSIAEKYSPNMKFEEKKRVYELRHMLPGDLQSRADYLANEIEEILQNQKKNLYSLNSGKLDSSSLTKLILGDVNLYYRDGDPKKFDGVCYFLMDNSGSMGYGRESKREFASEACAVSESAFKKLMPIKITAFDAQGSNYVTHECIKDFDEDQGDLSCSYNFLMCGRGGCGNKDGYSIRIATQELLERGEESKLLVILSDGCPSDYNGGMREGRQDVKSAVDEARSAGIQIVPIYFSDYLADDEDNKEDSSEVKMYKEMYGDDLIATTPDQIEVKLVEVLKNFYLN